jgi:cell division protein FtsL
MARTAAPAAARPASRRRASAPPPRRPPRRVSGPAAAGGGAVALPARVLRAPFARAARARAGTVLDALLQGRAWIALVAVLLVGIVFFNVDLLELNRDIARTADKAARIKRENAALSLQVARLASSDRIQRVAASRGLELPAPGDVHYLRLHPGVDARNAAARVVAPGSAGPAPSASGTPTPAPTPQPQSPGPGAQSLAPSAPATTPTPIPSSPPPPTTPQATGSPSGGAAPATGTGG